MSSAATPFRNGAAVGLNGNIPEHPQALPANLSNPALRDREPSPTLPSLPSHPTLNSLISSTLGAGAEETNHFNAGSTPPSDPAIVAIGGMGDENGNAIPPRIGDPGKRMLGHALGVRHPGLGARVIGTGTQRTASGSSPQAQPVAVIAE